MTFFDACILRISGQAMSNLAKSLADVGRHDDALVSEERTLEFFRRTLPEDHPLIGEGCVYLSTSRFDCFFSVI